jgi:hypothetical protein
VAVGLIVFGIWVLGRSPTVTGGQRPGHAGQPQSLPARNSAETPT